MRHAEHFHIFHDATIYQHNSSVSCQLDFYHRQKHFNQQQSSWQ